jgi:hypothetical protein
MFILTALILPTVWLDGRASFLFDRGNGLTCRSNALINNNKYFLKYLFT